MSASESIDGMFRQALACHERGQLSQAQAIYLEILKAQPHHSQSLHLLGVMAHQSGQPGVAVELIGRAIQADPGQPVFFYNRGNALVELAELEAAVASYVQAIRLQPAFAEAYASLGNTFLALKQFDNAVAAYDRAIAIKPGLADWHYNRGNALIESRRLEAAVASFDQAIALKPDFAEAHGNRGKALLELGQWPAAIASYDKAIQWKPTLAEAYVGRGHVLLTLQRLDSALADFDQAIQLKPGLAEAHHNRGNALQELQRADAAVASYDRAIALNPGYADAYANRGLAFQALKQMQLAAADYGKALLLKPDCEFLLGNYLHVRMSVADWKDFEADLSRLTSRIERGEKASPPFSVMAIADSPALQQMAAQIWAHAWHPPRDTLGPIANRTGKRKIRLGYYSGDFSNHPVAYLTAKLFESHDKSRFELFAFSFGPDRKDEMRQRVETAFDRFIDVRAMSDVEVARLSRDLEVDIAIDLKGFTQGSRCGMFAERSAPVQVNYLGYPGTMGVDYFDYVIADETVIPEENRQYHTEKVVCMPNSFLVNDAQRQISARRWTRAESGLPQTGFVFCCFNNTYKIVPSWFDIWMRLLKVIEGSVLWLMEDHPAAVANLRREAQQRGVDPGRLIFASRVPSLAHHLARYRLADLFIDTLPYNAHTTASDALWAGLPVLTCLGHSFVARVAGSLLHAVHLPELVTQSPAAYEALAIELATQPQQLAALRQKLDRERLSAPLFDTPLFTRHLEAAYTAMWDRYRAGLAPDHLHIHP